MSKTENIRLRHMLDAARKVMAFAQGRSRADLDIDEMLALALVRLLAILGEAAKRIPEAIRETHPQIPWRQMAGTRDRLIHGYFDVDLDVVWQIITHDLLLTAVGERARADVSTRGFLCYLDMPPLVFNLLIAGLPACPLQY
jgi:uncharacterized protein with HEPN domain